MKILKVFGLIILAIITLPLIIASFTSKSFDVEREVSIERPISDVFEYVKYLKNQNEYSKWALMDPDMEVFFSGTDGEVGFISAWKSEKEDVGKGEQEILNITPLRRIDYALRFEEPFESSDLAYMEFEEISANETLVKWGYNGKMNYPMNLMLLLIDFEKMIGDDLEIGLENLKNILEK